MHIIKILILWYFNNFNKAYVNEYGNLRLKKKCVWISRDFFLQIIRFSALKLVCCALYSIYNIFFCFCQNKMRAILLII